MKKTVFLFAIIIMGFGLWGCNNNTSETATSSEDESKIGETIPSPPTPEDPEASSQIAE